MQNNKYLKSESLSILLFCFMFLMYAVVYMTKNMFSSAMASIVEDGFMTKSQTGLINAVYWLTYSVFQVFGGFAADRYSPYKLIMIGLVGATVANIVIYFDQRYYVMMAAWAFNAVIQFGIWPAIFKVFSTQISPSMRGTAVFWMLFSTSVGLGLSMLVASFVSHWQQNFLVSIISLLIIIVIYAILNPFLEKRMVEGDAAIQNNRKIETDKAPMLPLMFSSGLIMFTIVSVLRIAVDNGIKMLTPVMLMESYDTLPAAIATRISSILIIFSAFGTFLAGFIKNKITANEAKAQILLYFSSLVPLVVVLFISRIHYIWILLSLSISVMLVHGASPFNQSYASLRFEKHGRIGTVSGILNAAASAGNILASYIFAKMSEIMPWYGVASSWVIAVIVCGMLCVFVLHTWGRFIKK